MAKTCWKHAYEDASRAIAADPTYAKGWFRRGKALEACHDANPALALALCDGRLQQHDGCNSVVDAVARDLHHAKCLVEGVPSSVTSTYTHAVPAGPKDVGGAGVFHPHVVITTTKTHGRSIQATQAIPPGTVLLTEPPTVLAVGTDVAACAACARVSLPNPLLPCDFCSADMYCDESCRAKAWADGHRWECSLTWQHVALDPLCRVYWRLLNRHRFQTNDDVLAQWKKVDVEPNTKGLRLWTTADELTVHALVHFPPLCHHLPSLSSSSVIHNHQFLALLDPSLDDNVPLGLVHLTPHQDGPIDVRLFVLTRPSKELYTLWLTQLQHVLSSHVKVVLHHAHMDTNLCAGALSAGFRPRSLPSSSEFTWNNLSGRFRGLDTLQSHLRSMPPVVAVETVLFVATLAVLDPWRGYLHDDDAQDMTLSVLLALAGQLPTNVVAITTTTTTAAAAPSSHNLRDVTQTRVGVGVYPRMAMANHSCVPNAFVRFDDGATLHLITSRAIAANDHVYISYGPHASKMDGPARRRHLQGQYFFACSCDACSSNDQVNEPPSDSVFMQRTHAMEAAIVVAIPKAHDDLHHVRRPCLLSVFAATYRICHGNNYILQAHELAQKLLHERLANLSNTHVLVGRAHDLVAQIAATRGDFAEAAAHSSKSLAILETHYAPFDAELGHEYLKLAQVRTIVDEMLTLRT
ncbi:hypothetical protein DYB36_004033 [Aphanomyces astaci]|uniref:MYND-type domain-containing protein n=1 Tax=Aphanomyces astaci TaxID=112090 RepID=A0A397ACH8_APHAT|nr:hypothetical protein DYB36_004033 [Aphanomyces astaci]